MRYNAKARATAFARSNGVCQLCGVAPAVESHHWAWPKYPRERDLIGDDLTALCQGCHEVATKIRRIHKYHGPAAVHDFHVALASVVERIFGGENAKIE